MKQWIALLLAVTTFAAGCRAETPRTPEEQPEPESELASAISERLAETGAEFAVA